MSGGYGWAASLHGRVKVKNRQEAAINCRNIWATCWVVGRN
jgi:hypothetical protein